EMMASDVASMAQENRARYLQALETGTLRGISATRGDASGAVFTEKINLNTATEAELMSLPGIGPAMAKRILAYRQNYGDFGSVEDLANVKGIGEKTIGKLRDLVTL
ncbi:MAG: ComEA family DNA-binding protein, partial [Fidelibacterota bacterium]